MIPVHTAVHQAAVALGRARLILFGRHHASIMAALGRTPRTLLEANAHRVQPVAEILEYDCGEMYPPNADAADVRRLCRTAAAARASQAQVTAGSRGAPQGQGVAVKSSLEADHRVVGPR